MNAIVQECQAAHGNSVGDLDEKELLEILKRQASKELYFTFDGLWNSDDDPPLINMTAVPFQRLIDGGAWVVLETERAKYKTVTMACRDALLAWCEEIAEGGQPAAKLRLRGTHKGAGFEYFVGPPGVRMMRI